MGMSASNLFFMVGANVIRSDDIFQRLDFGLNYTNILAPVNGKGAYTGG